MKIKYQKIFLLFFNISNDFIGRLDKDNTDNSWIFYGTDLFKYVSNEKDSVIYIEGTYEYAVEKINMLVEKYVNRFLEKEIQ